MYRETGWGILLNAGLGTAATRDIGNGLGQLLQVTSFGIGSSPLNSDGMGAPSYGVDANEYTRSGFFNAPGSSAVNFANGFASLIVAVRNGGSDSTGTVSQIQVHKNLLAFRAREVGTWADWCFVYHNRNTTKASDGTLKVASPVARIACRDTGLRPDVDEDSFEWCGYGVANDEARGIEIIRDDVGVYRVTGAKSLASSGWRLLPPQDPDGGGELGIVKAEQKDDEIIIKLFRRKMMLADGEIVIKPGDPIDVPANSWIDVRLDMPEPAIPPETESHSEDEEPLIQPQ